MAFVVDQTSRNWNKSPIRKDWLLMCYIWQTYVGSLVVVGKYSFWYRKMMTTSQRAHNQYHMASTTMFRSDDVTTQYAIVIGFSLFFSSQYSMKFPRKFVHFELNVREIVRKERNIKWIYYSIYHQAKKRWHMHEELPKNSISVIQKILWKNKYEKKNITNFSLSLCRRTDKIV